MKCVHCGSNFSKYFCTNCGEPFDLLPQDYIFNATSNINFLINCGQWSALKIKDINTWLNNFNDNTKEQYFAYRLLNQLIYYSEDDIKSLLYDGIFHKIILEDSILSRQINANFEMSSATLEHLINEEVKKTLFVPLLDDFNPGKSGNYITHILEHKIGIPSGQISYPFMVTNEYSNYERLIILDDCMGSGDQLKTFWTEIKLATKARTRFKLTKNSTKPKLATKSNKLIINNGPLLSDWCKKNNIIAYYLTLIGYNDNIDLYKQTFPDLKILCMETLNNMHRVFCDQSSYWQDDEERLIAESFFTKKCQDHCVPFRGYKGLDFALIMHASIPDWSLPIFWRSNPDRSWHVLMERKNSYV